MRQIFLVCFILLACYSYGQVNSVYKIVLKTKTVPGDIDSLTISKLSEPLKALTAFYAAMGGTMCNGEYCQLTTALGLGKQGSDLHKNLIKKYFPDDKVAEVLLKQNCYLRPSGASTFSDFEFITITDKGNRITVDYNLTFYDRGKGGSTKGPDVYNFNGNKFQKIKRHLWTHIDN